MKMYSIENKEAAVNTVLRYLGLVENGIFDERAKKELNELLTAEGLPPRDFVDYGAFRLLRENYKSKAAREASRRRGVVSFPFSFGDRGSEVALINGYLSDLLRIYSIDTVAPRGDYFTKDTEAAVLALRRIYLMDAVARVDPVFFMRLAGDRDAIFTDG